MTWPQFWNFVSLYTLGTSVSMRDSSLQMSAMCLRSTYDNRVAPMRLEWLDQTTQELVEKTMMLDILFGIQPIHKHRSSLGLEHQVHMLTDTEARAKVEAPANIIDSLTVDEINHTFLFVSAEFLQPIFVREIGLGIPKDLEKAAMEAFSICVGADNIAGVEIVA